MRRTVAGIGLCILLNCGVLLAQDAAPAAPDKASEQASPAGPDHARAYYHYMLGRRYRELAGILNRGDYIERAVAEYKQAIEADPESLLLRVELAELYWRSGRLADAVREAESVLKVNPDQADAHRVLAHLYLRTLGEARPDKLNKESLRKAIEHFEALARLNPSDAETYIVLGRLYKATNQTAKAEEAFQRLLNSNPNSKSALANLAQLYSEQGEYARAIEVLNKIPESEMDAPLFAMLGFAHTQNRDFEAAAAAYEKSLAQDADNQEIRRYYAEALMGIGKTNEARSELEKILKADPEDGPTYLRLAQLDREEGRFDQARQALEKAQSLLPGSVEVRYQLAQLEETVGHEDQAIQILQELVKQSERPKGEYTAAEASNRAIFLERLGLMYRSQEKFDQALEVFGQIVALGKDQAPRGQSLIIDTLRLVRQPQKALEEAEAAVKRYPDDRRLRMIRASLLGERGRVQEAVEQLQALLNGTPADAEIHLATAQVYSQAKRYSDAEAAIRKALELTPKTEDQEFALFMLGSVYERQKKYDLAEEQFKKVLAVNPLNGAAANYLGYMLADRGVRLEESVNYIKKALALEPNNGAYLDSLGWAYFKMSRYDLAEVHLEKAARRVSRDPTIHEHLGRLYLRLGKEALAQEHWERALKEWPNAQSGDFDAEQAAKLQKELEELKLRLAKEKEKPARR